MRKQLTLIAVAIPLLALVCAGLYALPPVNSRLGWRVDELQARIKYALNPPEEAIFVPQSTGLPAPQVSTFTSTPTMLPSPTANVPGPTETPLPSPTPTVTPTPLPERVMLENVKYEDQHNRWNYCGPANLSMALTFWGWDGNRDVVGKQIKPNDDDKNIMPYEMQDFVAGQTEGLSTLLRYGGDIELLKRLVAGGFPVIAEKGYFEYDYTGKLGWLGHYQFVTGYNDSKNVLIVQDTYIPQGENHEFPYDDFIEGWRSFNYVFLVVFPEDQRAEVLSLLGPYADADWGVRHALETAEREAETLDGIDQYFAYFNIGTSHVLLQEYGDATYAFDYAFGTLYPALPGDEGMRPYRMMWYQTWPYWAYFYTGRYQDVINLANTTLLETISKPVLEESFYWRGLAREALGETQGAIDDMRQAIQINENFTPAWQQLQRMTGGGG